jgi:hypothetical protein
MSEPKFPVPVEQIAQTLITLMKSKKWDRYVWILEGSTPSMAYLGSSNYGDYHDRWQLQFEVPIERFATIEEELKTIEPELLEKVAKVTRGIRWNDIEAVILAPQFIAPIAKVAPPPPDADVERIYGQGKFRLFISHLSKDKVFLSDLKQALDYRGIAAFLAHEDIEPTKEWQSEIELALRSMQAMVVFLVEGFNQSKWTEQEVGWAMGRGVLVIPIKVDIDPYGFMGKYQALRGQRENAFPMADMVVDLLTRNPQTHDAMRGALVRAMRHARSFANAAMLKGLLMQMRDYSESEKQMLLEAVEQNGQVSGSFGVPEWIEGAFGKTRRRTNDDAISF